MHETILKLPLQYFAEEDNPVDDGQGLNVEGQDPADETVEEVTEAEDGVTEPDESEQLTDEPGTEPQEVAKPAQSAAENAKFAALRRQLEHAERETARLEQEARKAQEYREVLGSLYGYRGNDDEIINHLVSQSNQMTPEQYRAQQEAQRAAIERTIQSDPRVRMAQEMTERMAVQTAMQRDFAAIKAAFPDETGADLNSIQNAGEVAKLICSGVDPVMAYRAVNFETLASKKAAAAKQAAANIQGKDHLKPTGGGTGGSSGAEIPKSMLSMYREIWPDETDAQLRARYNNVLKTQGE